MHDKQQRQRAATPERAPQRPVADDSLSKHSLLSLQQTAGNRAVAGLVAQRVKVGYAPVPQSGKPAAVELLDKAEPTGATVGELAPGEPATVVPVPGLGQPWLEVQPLGAPGRKKGFAPAPEVQQAQDIKEDDVAWTTDKTDLMASPVPVKMGKLDKLKSLVKGNPNVKKTLAKGTPVALQGTASQGLVEATVLEGVTPTTGYVEINKVTAPKRKLGGDSMFHKKNEAVLGPVKAGKTGSRDESARLLHEGADERVKKIVEAIESGMPALKAFDQVAFSLAGAVAGVETAYEQLTKRRLRRDIDIAFAGKPGPLAGPYLISMLDNDGRPSPKMAIALPLGKVDGSGAQGGKLGALVTIFTTLMTGHPKAGKAVGDEVGKLAKDKRRVGELVNRLTAPQIKVLLGDPEAMDLINSADGKDRLLQGRMEKALGVAEAKEAHEKALSSGTATEQKKAAEDLAIARDELLAMMVRAATKRKDVPGFKQAHGLFQAAREKLTGTPSQKTPRLHVGFDLASFYEDVVDWKQGTSPEDKKVLEDMAKSKFQHEWAKVPGTLLGVTDAEKASLKDFILNDTSKGKDLLLAAAKRQLTLQSGYAGREKDSGRGLGTRIRTAIVEKRWTSIEQQVKDLDDEQRRSLWTELGGDKGVEETLKASGLNREERAGILAMLGSRYGEAGGAYIDLKQLLGANTRSEIGSRLAYLSPTKWSKAGTGLSDKGLGLAAYKIVKEAADEDFIQIRQDKALLEAIEARSDAKTFDKIKILLGIKGSDDQLAETTDQGAQKSTRVLVDEARRAAVHEPNYWSFLLDEQIDESVLNKKNVSVGTDKAALYVLITRIQTTAREVGRRKVQEDPKADAVAEAQRFLNAVVSGLATKHQSKPAYLRKLEVEKGYPVWSALTKNQPIPVGSWMDRAEQEGFGVGSLRSTDRQKLTWAFETMDGKQLLDDWSNLYVFKFHDNEGHRGRQAPGEGQGQARRGSQEERRQAGPRTRPDRGRPGRRPRHEVEGGDDDLRPRHQRGPPGGPPDPRPQA